VSDRNIAIVGVSCRLPGGIADIDALWDALINGRDLVGTVPPDRFNQDEFINPDPKKPAKVYTNAGGFLDDIAGFDADFFGLSPREASRIDPQQRLLLELTVEALDDAGIDPVLLSGSRTGVFVGISGSDYSQLQHCSLESITAYTNIGSALSIAANRISYIFDLRGPSMVIDTACSSTLVALHQACNSLRSGETTVALAAGVNIVLSPYPSIGFSKASMLSPTGRCHAFGAAADGYVRAEGGGIAILKPLAAALRDGDRIHAVIRATAVNSDGRTVGLALPNVHAQIALLREVYKEANIEPEQLSYFEAHGTGTLAGDPVECQAIGAAIGTARRSGNPLPIGSVKTNVGHLEPASGIAGLLKAILVLRHGEIPPSLWGTPANPDIDFAGLNLTPVASRMPLSRPDSAVIGVNSFGFGGTNAHVALSAAPQSDSQPVPRGLHVVMVSAKSDTALRAAAGEMARLTRAADNRDLYDIGFTSCVRRTRYDRRLAVIGRSGAEIADRLDAFTTGSLSPGAAVSSAAAAGGAAQTGKVAFAFSGNGSQWAGMASDLLDSEPAFRAAVTEVDSLVRDRAGWSAIDELRAPASLSRLTRTEFAQPALFAVQVGLVALLRERGIRPQATFGHSVGEIAAAHAAGALDLESAVHIVLERSHAQAVTAGAGRMAAVGLPAAEACKLLAAYDSALELAAVNSGSDVTIAGDAAALARLGEDLASRGTFFRLLDLDYAFHTAKMDPIRADLLTRLGSVRTGTNICPFVSTVTGKSVDAAELEASYWWRNIRQPVLFADAVSNLVAEGFDIFVEIGPHSVLSGYLRKVAGQVVPTLKRGGVGSEDIDTAVASLIASGAEVDWSAWFPSPGRVVSLPAYPWQRERHWNGDTSSWLRSGWLGSGGGTEADHPLLGRRLPSLEPTWVNELSSAQMEPFADHRVGDSVVMPATGFATLALEAGRHVLGDAVEILGLELLKGLVFQESGTQQLQVSVSSEDGAFRIASRADAAASWQIHARGRVQQRLRPAPPAVDIAAIRACLGGEVTGAEHYLQLAAAGLPYGPNYQVIRALAVAPDTVLASYALASGGAAWEILPRVLDGGLQAAMPFVSQANNGLFLPAAVGKVQSWRVPALTGFALVRREAISSREIGFSVSLMDGEGAIAVTLSGCRLRRFESIKPPGVTRHAYVLRSAYRPQLAGDAAPSIAPTELAASLEGQLRASKIAWRTAHHYTSYEPRVDALCSAFAARALAAFCAADRTFDVDDLLAAGVQSSHRRLLSALLEIAESDGYIAEAGAGRWRVTSKKAEPDALFPPMVRDFPEYNAELLLLGRCGLHLADVLRGTVTGLELIFSERGTATEAIYDSAPFARFYNDVIRSAVRQLVARWPAGRPLRILEIGGGTGGVTAAILPLLPPDFTHYTFTDLSDVFTLRAADRFRDYDFMDFRRLDVERDPEEQGFAEGSFDVVIAANIMHATADLRNTLEHAGSCLRPGGMLLALEKHDQRSLTMVFGTLSGWWLFTDTELRRQSPLLSATRWPGVLADAGFDDVAILNDAEPGFTSQDSIILARQGVRPAAAPARLSGREGNVWIIAAEPADNTPAIDDLDRLLKDAGCLSVRAFSAESAIPNGDDVAVIQFDRADEWLALVEAAADEPTGVHIVLVLGMNAAEGCAGTVARAMYMRAISGALSKLPSYVETNFWLVTRPSGALPFPEQIDAPSHAAAWGVSRSLANEVPTVKMRRISAEPGLAADIARELVDPSEEDEIILTRNGRFVSRLKELRAGAGHSAGAKACDFALTLRNQGVAYRLPWVERPRPVPGPGEIAIEVKAVGVNYHDVLWAMGILTDEAVADGYCGDQLGLECSGVVIAVGSDVRNFAPGDRVYGMAKAALASHALCPIGIVDHMPEAMTFAEAATLVAVFITVHYSLTTLGHMQAGETILIHGATGGVGLAAIQHAKATGATIIATAGTEEKRDYLRLLGVDHVLDSRSLVFSEAVMEITKGRGVDLILNSLAGEAVLRNLEILRPFGRFIELGKRDFYANNRIGLRPFRNNISFFGVDIDQMVLRERELVAAEFATIEKHVRAGTYRPLPHRVYPAARVEEAFRLMQNSQHIGKVVISLAEAPPVETRPPVPALDPAGTYVVVGGNGGFGAEAAVWLAGRGARHVALVGRRGAAAPEAAATIARLSARGATAAAYAVDATDLAAMQSLFADIDRSGAPVCGVIHAAMVLDDAALSDMTPGRFAAALAPKMAAGQVLDRLTRQRTDSGQRLDLFVIFSSVTATFGTPGQTNYIAGNLYLEAMVRARRQAGLPGLAIGWGAIGEAGYLARDNRAEQICERLGVHPISLENAFAALDDLVARDAEVVSVGQYDWQRIQQVLFSINAPRLAAFKTASVMNSEQDAEDLARTLRDLPEDEVFTVLEDMIARLLSEIFRTAPDRIDRNRSLQEMGMDSLMAVELQVVLERQFGCDIPVMEVVTTGGIRDLARLVAPRLGLVAVDRSQAEPAAITA
jgi:acyl transferase domain-containing protein/NADPH:quinone reductase-like Zn-dependent oxidoreductase/SAM-dependent methyltransferase/acyl carrier protein